jgi:hypothetical protein
MGQERWGQDGGRDELDPNKVGNFFVELEAEMNTGRKSAQIALERTYSEGFSSRNELTVSVTRREVFRFALIYKMIVSAISFANSCKHSKNPRKRCSATHGIPRSLSLTSFVSKIPAMTEINCLTTAPQR